MRVDARKVLAHPVVVALSDAARLTLLALLRAADQWGELTRAEATTIARKVAATTGGEAPAGALAELHEVALLTDAGEGIVCAWTPQQREDAAVFSEVML